MWNIDFFMENSTAFLNVFRSTMFFSLIEFHKTGISIFKSCWWSVLDMCCWRCPYWESEWSAIFGVTYDDTRDASHVYILTGCSRINNEVERIARFPLALIRQLDIKARPWLLLAFQSRPASLWLYPQQQQWRMDVYFLWPSAPVA